MNLLLIVDDYLPHSTKVAAKMMHELAMEFLYQGHSVSVITPDPQIKNNYVFEEIDEIFVYRFRSGKIKNVSKIRRVWNEFLLPIRAWYYLKDIIKNIEMDLIIYYSPSIFWGPLIMKLKKKWNCKSYLILRDFFPQWAIDNGLLKNSSLITWFFRWFENFNYKQAENIGVMSPANLRWFEAYYKGNSQLEVLFNWVTDNPLKIRKFTFRENLGIQKKVVFFYGGNIGHAQDMNQIITLAKNLLNHKQAHIVLVGAGDEVELIKTSIQRDNLTNITLLDSVNQEVYREMLAEFDVGLFCLNKNHKTHNFPGKILGYLVQGLPILGSVNPGNDLKEVIEDYRAGFVVDAGNEKAFYEKAILLLNSKTRDEISSNAKKLLSEKFSIKKISDQILSTSKC